MYVEVTAHYIQFVFFKNKESLRNYKILPLLPNELKIIYKFY